MIPQENLSNRQEVNKRSHYDSLSLSVFSSNPINPDFGNGINPHIRDTQKIYFTTLKKHNTFYLRVSQRDQLQNASVTVSLRTESRREAKMRSD
ncbi:integrase, partial [Vibrio cholerae]|nr:integrase [Vibrio cholerae]